MKALVAALIIVGFATSAQAAETMGEAATAKAHDVKRSMKKGMHRAQEALCAKGDVECLKQRAENRAKEAKDYTKDKAEEVKNKVD